MVIKEFLPNPVGSDAAGEYIKLLNDSDKPADLSGWQLKDASGKNFSLVGTLKPGEGLILPYSVTKISLNNNGEAVYLLNPEGMIADELSYSGQAAEGQIVGKLQMTNSQMINDNSAMSGNLIKNNLLAYQFIFMDFLVGAILAGLGLYVIIQLEKYLSIKLYD